MLERELVSVPSYLSKEHRSQISQLEGSLGNRAAELKSLKRLQSVADWQKQFFEIEEIESLDRLTTEKLLVEIDGPPFDMRSEELEKIEPVRSRLTAHLDQISMDDLFRRIEQLKPEKQQQLLKLLSELLSD